MGRERERKLRERERWGGGGGRRGKRESTYARERERGAERERQTDTWFIVKATDPYTKSRGEGGGDKYVLKKSLTLIGSTVPNCIMDCICQCTR